MTENWQPVKGYEGIYDVSDWGNVRRVYKGFAPTPYKLLVLRLDKKGYQTVGLSHEGKCKRCFVHRLVAFAFLGDSPAGKPEVNHINGVRDDNQRGNLEWCSHAENIRHSVYVLRNIVPPAAPIKRGSENGASSLTEQDVTEIRALYAGGMKQRDIAEKYSVTQTHISRIVRREIWTHV